MFYFEQQILDLYETYDRGKGYNISSKVLTSRSGSYNNGEKNGNSKLNDKTVKEIKIMLTQGIAQLEIAKIFSICLATVNSIKNLRRWKHVYSEINDTIKYRKPCVSSTRIQ